VGRFLFVGSFLLSAASATTSGFFNCVRKFIFRQRKIATLRMCLAIRAPSKLNTSNVSTYFFAAFSWVCNTARPATR